MRTGTLSWTGGDWRDRITATVSRILRTTSTCTPLVSITASLTVSQLSHLLTIPSDGLCVWENIGWYNLSNIGWIDFELYQQDIDSLAPQVSEQLQWSGLMGECWYNSTMDVMDYFEGCDYTDEDWTTLYNIVYAWSDMTCFGYIFSDACSGDLRGEIYYYFSQAYTNSYDYTDYTAGGRK